MKKSTLLVLLDNIYADAEQCNCYSVMRKIEFIIQLIKKEGVEDD